MFLPGSRRPLGGVALLLAAALLGPPAPGTASAALLAVRMDDQGVLRSVAADRQRRDSQRREAGSTLICRWKLPDVEKVEWPLKQRGIVYKRAYRRCYGPGGDLHANSPQYARKGDTVFFSTEGNGLWVMDRRGRFKKIPGFGGDATETGDTPKVETTEQKVEEAPVSVRTRCATRPERDDLFILSARKDSSIFSSLLDRWRSDLWWIPDLAAPENSTMIMSRGNDRIEMPMLYSPADTRRAEALQAMDLDGLVPVVPAEPTDVSAEPPPEPEAGTSDEETPVPPPADWLWNRTRQAVALLTEALEAPELPDRPALYFLQNGGRIGRLAPGESEMTLFPELDPFVFRDGVKAFRILDPRSALVLSLRGLFRIDLPSGHHELVSAVPADRIRHLYGELALSADQRFAAFRAWTTAHRQEIYVADLREPGLRVVVRGEMDLRFRPDAARSTEIGRFNPGPFNFSPDGMELVTLWRVLDGQEMRVYRLVGGDHASVPLKPEEPETGDAVPPETAPPAAGE